MFSVKNWKIKSYNNVGFKPLATPTISNINFAKQFNNLQKFQLQNGSSFRNAFFNNHHRIIVRHFAEDASNTTPAQAIADQATGEDVLKKGRRKKIVPLRSGEGTPFNTEEGTPFVIEESSETPFDPNRELTPSEQLRDMLRKKKWEEAEQLLVSSAEKGTPFSKQEYLYLFDHFGKSEKKIESYHNFLEQMTKYNIGGGPDTNTYYTLMVALAKRGSTDDVMWAFLGKRKQNTPLTDSDMLHRKIKPSDQILHFVIPKIFNKIAPYKKKKTGEGAVDTAGEAQADASFRRFLVFLRDLGVWPDPFVYQLIIKQCEVMGYPRTMLKYHEEMKMAEKLKIQLQKEKEQKEKAAQPGASTSTPTPTATTTATTGTATGTTTATTNTTTATSTPSTTTSQ